MTESPESWDLSVTWRDVVEPRKKPYRLTNKHVRDFIKAYSSAGKRAEACACTSCDSDEHVAIYRLAKEVQNLRNEVKK